jgi:polysaccharide export outer membrane protein
MKVNKFVLACGLCSGLLGQTGVLMTGHVNQNGLMFNYETRLEPPTPPLEGGLGGGVTFDRKGMHRHIEYRSTRQFFGYDLAFERTDWVTFSPLSIDAAAARLQDPEKWTTIALSAYPAPQRVREGDTIAIDLFTNPTTGQKITDYLHFPRTTAPYVISAGDVLFINVLHQPEATGTVEVRPDGLISMRFAGEVKAAGLTTLQLADEIIQRLSKSYSHPDVNVQVIHINITSKYSISGEIKHPGPYSLNTPKTVLEAIIEAGGLNDFAKRKGIYIVRGQYKLPFNYADVSKGKNLEQNIQLQNGDVIVVP